MRFSARKRTKGCSSCVFKTPRSYAFILFAAGPYLKCNPRARGKSWTDTTQWDCTYGNGVLDQNTTNGCACARANRTVRR